MRRLRHQTPNPPSASRRTLFQRGSYAIPALSPPFLKGGRGDFTGGGGFLLAAGDLYHHLPAVSPVGETAKTCKKKAPAYAGALLLIEKLKITRAP